MKNKLSAYLIVAISLSPLCSHSTPTIGDLDKTQSSIQFLKAKNEELALKLQQADLNKKLGGSNGSESADVKTFSSTYSLSEIYGGRRGLSASLMINGRPQSVKIGDRLLDGSVVKNITRSSVGLQLPDGMVTTIQLR